MVNNEVLNFELEKEISLPQILENIQSWAIKDNLFILDYKVNGQNVENNQEQYDSNNIEKLEVTVGSRQSLLWENILELQHYISKMVHYIVPRIQDSLSGDIDQSTIKEGMEWISASYQSLQSFFAPKDVFVQISDEAMFSENYVLVINEMDKINQQVNLWKKQLFYNIIQDSDVEQLYPMYVQELKLVLDKLEEIASNLTVGKDAIALFSLENIIEWLSAGLAVFEKANAAPDIMEKIKANLVELDESLKNRDFVGVADIVDFDLRENLSNLLESLSET